MLSKNLTFVDIETTGPNLLHDSIIEIGILRVENNKLVRTYQSLINPTAYVSPFIENITGINRNELENAPSFREIKDEILDILKDSIFVAHNVRFDYGFLKNEFKRLEYTFKSSHFCTVKLSQYLYPKYRKHSLDDLISRFNINCKNRHRALDDARVLFDFFEIIRSQFPEKKLKKAIDWVMKKPQVPINISKECLENLPESPGVYIFYGASGTPLYIGKSKNIKERVLSHFSRDHASSQEMAISQQIESIETIETFGELGALFKESSLIKEMQPFYNRKLRLKRKLIILKEKDSDKGYKTVSIETLDKINVSEIDNILGIFTSKSQTKQFLKSIAKKHSLCEKILGIEKSKRACFGYHLGWCKGACKEKEIIRKYNLRFITAFSAYKLKSWPFNGPIIIEEKDITGENLEKFVIDKWCFIGSIKNEVFDKDSILYDYSFDYDTYKILFSYINTSKNLKNIKKINNLAFFKDNL